jgi:hypothetical protein
VDPLNVFEPAEGGTPLSNAPSRSRLRNVVGVVLQNAAENPY